MDVEHIEKAVKGNQEKARSETDFLVNRYGGGRYFRFVAKTPLPGMEKSVLTSIASYLDVDQNEPFAKKTAWPSYDTIADDSGFSKRSVQRAIAFLERHGFVTRERRRRFDDDGFETNIYSIEPSLPVFYEHSELLRKLRKAKPREKPMYLSRLDSLSLEIWTFLQLDTITLQELAELKPGLFESSVKPWLESETARGMKFPKRCEEGGGDSASPPGGGDTESPGVETERRQTRARASSDLRQGATRGSDPVSPELTIKKFPIKKPKKKQRKSVNPVDPERRMSKTRFVGLIGALYESTTKRVVVESLVDDLRESFTDAQILPVIKHWERRMFERGKTLSWEAWHKETWRRDVEAGIEQPSPSHDPTFAAEAAL